MSVDWRSANKGGILPMSAASRVLSNNLGDLEARRVIVPSGNKTRSVVEARKPALKTQRKVGRTNSDAAEEKIALVPSDSSSILSLDASSSSSDASTDSSGSRDSIEKIHRQRQGISKLEKIVVKPEKITQDGYVVPQHELSQGKKRCSWVTPNTDPCYAAFHDEEWGFPVHDDRKLFELLVLSGALAELTWPAILSKRHIFREIFMGFDPVLVARLNEKKIVASAISLLSEPKLRAIIENARQILKIIEEFGSLDEYCWSFVGWRPIAGRFRNLRQVPAKTPKADALSRDLMRRGLRCVGPTVVYAFMQATGITNGHFVGCYRFEECGGGGVVCDGWGV